MSVPSMVHRSGGTLTVRSIVSGDQLFGPGEPKEDSGVFSDPSEDPSKDIKSNPLPDCKVKRNYSCTSCSYFTQNPRRYLYHLRDVHKQKVKIYECPNCLYASKHFQKLLRHTRMVHGTTATASASESPDSSRAKTKKRSAPAMEDEDESGERDSDAEEKSTTTFKCSVCAFLARSQSQLTKHERDEHIKTKFFRCSKCTYVTHMKARFTKHVKYHSMPMIKCDMCDFRTPYKWNLDRHCKNHNGKGAFKCSACNFTADIKQSLTVHEMNHHVPPVGQAAGLGVGRRRNKVGASDSAAAEEAALQLQQQVTKNTESSSSTSSNAAVNPEETHDKTSPKLKTPSTKKQKTSTTEQTERSFGSDFIHPDDIIHHANGNVYIKNKCQLCNFKSAWDSEMTKHELKVHNIGKEEPVKVKKPARPIPNLIPIPTQTSVHKIISASRPPEPEISQKDINEICAKSENSALKDFAFLLGNDNMFKDFKKSPVQSTSKVPDLIPTSEIYTSTPKNATNSFKEKNASFFDQLKEKLMSGTNLICKFCGHESKCLTEHIKHNKTCGNEPRQVPNITPIHNISSSRCQYCRQRCKSSTDLFNHLQTCNEALKTLNQLAEVQQGEDDDYSNDHDEGQLKIDESQSEDNDKEDKHPMENRVFVWNNIEVPMDIEVDDSNYEYTDDRIDDNVSLDLSIRTQSPGGSESSFVTQEVTTIQPSLPPTTTTTEKIPTHGTDISIAQHKRVFQCPHCTFWASTASRFHVHIVGHLNKKPFECSLCSYRSNWRWDITKHIKLKSVRDPAHETAKVLMTDETGRRNYTKYNKYLTEIHVSGEQSMETSGGSGTRHRHHDKHGFKGDLSKVGKTGGGSPHSGKNTQLRPPPPLKMAGGDFLGSILGEKKKSSTENKRTLFKCKKCNFRHASREVLLEHVKGHYTSLGTLGNNLEISVTSASPEKDERHCRLKHSGDIRVVSNKNGQEKLEVEEQTDEPDHVDIPQTGTYKCKSCPYSHDNPSALEDHRKGHSSRPDSISKCPFCTYFVSQSEDLLGHLPLHGIQDVEDFISRMAERGGEDFGKRFKCMICPYVTNSKSQYTYHKQFHKPRGGQYTCDYCSYNVSKRHLLHQHLKVHGINIGAKQNGDVDMDEIDEIEVPSYSGMQGQEFSDIPLVWVSKNGNFSKMYKCRFCPHVNLRKVNIQEHEKMHSFREKNPNAKGTAEVEHRCTECNYVCNNAGVLSSHSKVHQGLYGTVHCLVDPTRSDEEQIGELSKFFGSGSNLEKEDYENCVESIMDVEEGESSTGMLYFCNECPARFLKENEFQIHRSFHGGRLFYKCEHCSYTARQKPHLLAHNQVHTNDYLERTKVLQENYPTSPMYNQPQIYPITNGNNELIWIVFENNNKSDLEIEFNAYTSTSTKPSRSLNVPLSGTELFQQKSEAQAAEKAALKHKEPSPPVPLKSDPQFGTLMHGNPNFVYPTCLKNGKMKEKRYKCHKCPSAFEKREQYRVHLGLHGSQQRYNCEHCDYSVKYYANYVQHVKKHKMNADALAARRSSDQNDDVEVESDNEEVTSENTSLEAVNDAKPKETSPSKEPEERRLFWCMNCPYTNYRKDAVDNHQKRHIVVSGIKNNYTCTHCDYSVPQAHFLREHVKLHFMANKVNPVEGYMACENLKLTSNQDESKSESIIFEEDEQKCTPALSEDVTDRFNNNEGEKQFVNLHTGEILKSEETVDVKQESSTEN